MKMELLPEYQDDRLEIIESRFYPAAQAFAEAKHRDERDACMNIELGSRRKAAAEGVNGILDDYLDLCVVLDLTLSH